VGIELHCEKCGKLLSVEAAPGSTVNCPHCRNEISVPAGSAQPARVPTRARPGAAAGVMTLVMPWIISVLLHLGLALVMVFITMYVLDNPVAEDVVVPDAKLVKNPGGPMRPAEAKTADETRTRQKLERRYKSEVEAVGKMRKKASVMAMGSSSSGSGLLRSVLPESRAPRSKMFGVRGGNVYHVAYVIDRSGSMVDDFEQVCQELAISIGELQEIQDFHVILFADGPPLEYRPKKLVPATARHKDGAARFLEENHVRPLGQTNPIPALMRAFAVLQDAATGGKLIYLLTDAEFQNNEMVLAAIRQWNADKSVHINTFLYGRRPPGAERVMQQIAKENGGRYKYVSPDE